LAPISFFSLLILSPFHFIHVGCRIGHEKRAVKDEAKRTVSKKPINPAVGWGQNGNGWKRREKKNE
jgi:hypothetical protein